VARRASSRDRTAPGGVSPSLDALQNIVALIDSGGQISIGGIDPVPCAAIANDDHQALAMLQRRRGESLHQLLVRLDSAIATAWNEERFIDEINPPSTTTSRRP
jgi:hypothetical protein